MSAEAGELARTLRRIATSKGLSAAERALALGAVEHALANAAGDPADLISAFEHTEEALALDPSSLAALFNRGLIAADLGLCRLAARTWRQYLNRDETSGWAEEARQRLSLLPCTREGKTFLGPSSDDLITNALEALLPRWIEARRQSSPAADEILREISRAGMELSASSGEPMIRELARELGTMDDPLTAFTNLVEGRKHFEDESYGEAWEELRIAARLLRERRSPLASWAEVWLSGIETIEGRFEASERRLTRLARSPEAARSPYLMGKVFWARGFAALRAGRLQTGQDRLLRAEKEFTRGKYRRSAASVRTLRAETLAHLGFVREAWRPRVLALRALQDAPGPFSFFHNGLVDGAAFAQRTGAWATADAFLGEAAEVARSQGNAASEVETLLNKARALRQRGAHAEASADLRRALSSLRPLASDVRERFEKTALVGLWADPDHPAEKPEELLDAVSFFTEKGPDSLKLQALRVKAAMERRNGDLVSAWRTLDDALQVIHHLQKDIDAEETGIRHLDSIQDLFDEAIELAATEDPLRALALLESARRSGAEEAGAAEALSKLHLEAPGKPPSATGEPVVVVFCITQKTFLWWRIQGHAVRWGRSEASFVEAAVRAVIDSAPTGNTTPAELERLYDVLLAGALRDVSPGHPLVVVPDGLLQRVPFSALRNSGTGVRLIEERAVSLRTSLQAALETKTNGRYGRRTGWRVIAVGDPAFDVQQLSLERLPGAEREAGEVAGIYGERGHLLTGEAATARNVRKAAASAEVLHLATHATVSIDGFRDALALAAGPDGEDSGLVGATEILPAESSLQLAVLSGCSTLGIHPSRSGGLLGLARAFVAHGVPATLGTLWRVDDRLFPDLMADFHRFLIRGDSAAEALRQAQLAYLVENPEACCDWAALQLVGDLPAESETTR